MTIIDHGIPVRTARQWTVALSPNPTNTGWNFIAASTAGNGNPTEWAVIEDLTSGAPVTTIYDTTTHHYPNSNIRYVNANFSQLRALNGRIFFPLFGPNVAYYDPTTEAVLELATVPETPPVNPNSSQTYYSASFDVGGLLYFGTQESEYRRAMIAVVDTTTTPPTQTILGYVGSGAQSYTTYAYRIAPDTATATKHIYVAYGENPWQLWDLDLVAHTATKLYIDVPSTGTISFIPEPGLGWVADIRTNLGNPALDVHTKLWCLDGAVYAYAAPFAFTCDHTVPHLHAVAHGKVTGDGPVRVSTTIALPTGLVAGTDYWFIRIDDDNFKLASSYANAIAGTAIATTTNGSGGQTATPQPPSSLARNVTPAANPVINPPELDTTGGIGVVGWRTSSIDPYTYVNYSVVYTTPTPIESLVASNDGIVGNAQSYSGFVKYVEPADTHTWFGPWSAGLSQGPRINLSGIIYAAGYPNGVLFSYDPDAAWTPYDTVANPKSLGNYGLNGTQFAGIKYTDFIADGPLAGTAGRLFACGSRERNGSGSGIGSWDKATKAFAGTFSAAGMSTCLPDGLVVLAGMSSVVMSTRLMGSPPAAGTAKLFVFDYAMGFVTSLVVVAGLNSLGQIYETTTPNVITGIVQGTSNQLRLWQYNVQTQTLVADVTLSVVGVLGAQCQQFGGDVWLMSGSNLVRVNVSTLAATVIQDLSSIMPVSQMAFASDHSTLWMAGAVNSGQAGAQLFSISNGQVLAAATGVGIGTGFNAVLSTGGSTVLLASTGVGIGIGGTVTFTHTLEQVAPGTGDNAIQLISDESTPIVRGQPVFSSGDGRVRLAAGDGTGSSLVVGFVADEVIYPGQAGNIVLGGVIEATLDQWDTVCGTTGGLAFDVIYYLDLVPGRMNALPPQSGEFVPTVKALSPFKAIISTKPPVLL